MPFIRGVSTANSSSLRYNGVANPIVFNALNNLFPYFFAPFSVARARSNAEDNSLPSPTSKPPPALEMTAEEKQRANRDRNREHAKKTRMRKKAYLEQLKNTVENLQSEVAQAAAEKQVREAGEHRGWKEQKRREIPNKMTNEGS